MHHLPLSLSHSYYAASLKQNSISFEHVFTAALARDRCVRLTFNNEPEDRFYNYPGARRRKGTLVPS